MTRFENANGARSSPLLPSAVADACSLQAQLSDGNVSLKHTETRSKKAFSISSNGRAWANGSGARGAKKEADAPFSLTWEAHIPPIWILRLGGTPPLPEMLRLVGHTGQVAARVKRLGRGPAPSGTLMAQLVGVHIGRGFESRIAV